MSAAKAVGIGLVLASFAWAGPKVGDAVPDLKVTTLQGQEIQLSELKAQADREGKIVVIASWSFKCPAGVPFLQYHKDLAKWCEERGVVYVGVAMYGEGAKAISKHMEDTDIQFPLVDDKGCEIAEFFDTRVVNTAYVIDKDGVLRYAGGLKDGADDPVRQAVTQLQAGQEVQVTAVRPFG